MAQHQLVMQIMSKATANSNLGEGQHTGRNFGDIFVDTLNSLRLSNKLVSITANNASSNSTLAAHVQKRLGGIFKANGQLLGCMAHVINLAAQNGIKVFGSSSGTE
ncbi:hypothetical protein PCANC_21088 [Puccinia coronata f. sp. avenae]|uniref:DUF659 domain-containing protein n=1 Tax=Puccinia coronata f. sp. avenae TaxID=200324 RepID=A0A2N5TXA9_9BASI|nr:hypothetical protein PCANC_21088 [Puccinia coronata f. sp. avenae]